MCYRKYPLEVERYQSGEDQEPESWRDLYFVRRFDTRSKRARAHAVDQVLKETEAKRLEEVGARIRTRRLEAEECKKEREVKLTDRAPPPAKRSRGGCKFK